MKNNTIICINIGLTIVNVAICVLSICYHTQRNYNYSDDDINVYSGDTVWGISSEYLPQCTDKRGRIHIVTADNTCTVDTKPGQKISVRAYEKK